MFLRILLTAALFGCATTSSSSNDMAFADVLINPNWIEIDDSVTSSILSQYKDMFLYSKGFRYKNTETIIVRAFSGFTKISFDNKYTYCVSEAQDIIIPRYDSNMKKDDGAIFRYPNISIFHKVEDKNQCFEKLGQENYFYALNERSSYAVNVLPNISAERFNKFCSSDALRPDLFNVRLMVFNKKSLQKEADFPPSYGYIEFEMAKAVYQLRFSLDFENKFIMLGCKKIVD